VCLIAVTIVFGVYGYSAVYVLSSSIDEAELTRWLDILYSTLRLFSLESSPSNAPAAHWAISVAHLSAVCSVFFTIGLAAFIGIKDWFKSNVSARFYRNHYIVVGLNAESYFLTLDLLKNKKKVIVVEVNPTNPLSLDVKAKGAIVIVGDGSTFSVLLRAEILKAKALVAMTGDDLTNLASLQAVMESPEKPELQCYVGIDNVINYKLFEPKAFYSIQNIKKLSSGLYLNIFNLKEQAAIELVQNMGIGDKVDTVSNDSLPINILIAGFDGIGEAVLRELLLMCHFCNQKKVKLVIFDDRNLNEDIGVDFYLNQHQIKSNCNGEGLDLWDIEFVSKKEDLPTLSNFDHIVSCYEEQSKAVETILRFYDSCTMMSMREKDESTSFYYYSAKKQDIKHQNIKSFGHLEDSASYKQLIHSSAEALAKTSHNLYARSELGLGDIDTTTLIKKLTEHDKATENANGWLLWLHQPLFKRRSNFTEKRHFRFKLLALGGDIPHSVLVDNETVKGEGIDDLPFLKDLAGLDEVKIKNWVNHILSIEKIDKAELIQRIHNLAKTEHNRWNAFHVVNNWRYGLEKNESLKTHDCLLSWSDLEKLKPETIKYDYKNIYHIAESLSQ